MSARVTVTELHEKFVTNRRTRDRNLRDDPVQGIEDHVNVLRADVDVLVGTVSLLLEALGEKETGGAS